MLPPADAPPQLVQLGEPVPFRVLDYHDDRVGHVHAHLYHSGGNQKLGLPPREKEAITRSFPRASSCRGARPRRRWGMPFPPFRRIGLRFACRSRPLRSGGR